MDRRKWLPRSMRYPVLPTPPASLCRTCGSPYAAHVAYDDGQPPLCPGMGGLTLWTQDTKKPGEPME